MRNIAAAGMVVFCAFAIASDGMAQPMPAPQAPSTSPMDPGFRSTLLSDAAVQADARELPAGPPVVAINWAAARHDAETRSSDYTAVRPRNSRRNDVDDVTLPVLFPAREMLNLPDAEVRFFPRENLYVLSVTGEDAVIEVFGTRLRHGLPPDPATERRMADARDADGYLTVRGEGSWDISFDRYGAAYSVTVECSDPAAERCADADYARRIAVSLVMAGGAPGAGE